MSSVAESRARPWTIRDAVVPGVAAVRSHWRPFLLIQFAAALMVLAYYRSDALESVAAVLARWKVQGGLPFSFIAGALAGGIMPEIAKAVTGMFGKLDRHWAISTAHTTAVFGVVGVMVDLFYRFQGFAFGWGIDPQTLVIKTVVDMGLFAPLIAIPFEVVVLEWGHRGYHSRVLWANLSGHAYRDRVLPAMIPCWAFWIPVLFCVYAMPQNLQFPFSILAEAAWSIIVVFVARRPTHPADAADRALPRT